MFFAKRQQPPDSRYFSVTATEKSDSSFSKPTYELKIVLSRDLPALQLELNVDGPIWSPSVYKNVTAALAKNVGIEASKQNVADDTKMLLELTDGTASTIEMENQRLSKALQANFSDALSHEKAAALLGAFTLREHSGDFFEIRSPLCRITAHLAVAQYLSGGEMAGINGRMAEAMLFSLMNDQVAAVEKLNGIEKSDDVAVNCWIRTLQAYNTSDYRPLAEIKDPSLIEHIAWFRAFVRSVDTDIAWEKLARR